jgi:indole-3-glycerol phosphate synthase
MTYKTKDGLTFKAHTYSQIIAAIRKSSKFDSDCSNEEFICRFAKRYKTAGGISLSVETTKKFIEDLINNEYLLKQ